MNRFIIIVVLFSLLSCGSRVSQKNNENRVDKTKHVFQYHNNDIEEEYFSLGYLSVLNSEYRVYNCFKKIKTAQDYHGQSLILFLSKRDTFVYQLDFIDDLPDSIHDNNLFKNGVGIEVNEMSNPLCLQNGCYDLVVSYKAILLSIDSLGSW